MSDTYFDLPSRLEDSFPEIDSDIVTDLRKTSEEYADIQQQISDLKKQFPCIMKVMEDKGEIHLTRRGTCRICPMPSVIPKAG